MPKEDGTDKENKSYYQQLKTENEQMHDKLAWFEDKRFFLKNEADPDQIYGYLKSNPVSAKFIYKKYVAIRPILNEICDPDNPLYLEEVANELIEAIKVTEAEIELADLERKKFEKQQEKNNLDIAYEKIETEYNRLTSELEENKKQINEIQRITANLSTEEAQNRIKSFYESVLNFTESISQLQKKQPISASYSGLKLELNHVNTLKLLGEKAKMDMEYITKEDLISVEKLDEQRKRIKEDMEKEKEEGMKSMDSFMAYNPKKELSKSLDKIELALKQLNQGIPMDGNTVSFYTYGIATISENLAVPKLLIGNLLKQVDNVDRRRKQ